MMKAMGKMRNNLKKTVLMLAAASFFLVSFASSAVAEVPDNPVRDAYEQLLMPRIENGEKWGIAWEDLDENIKFSYNGFSRYQSASVIKVFIMGTVYERICYPSDENEKIEYQESYEGELRQTIEQMITVSDNEAANTLIDILGGGDTEKGKEAVNEFCESHGYKQTHLGRKFLESDPADDNYTSPSDCRKILSEIYNGKLVNEEASEKMLEILKGQTLKNKIPSLLPEGFKSANKTGEMPEGYGLGCIENDMAIIFGPDGRDFILVILSNDLAGRNDEAQQVIRDAARMIALEE